MSSASDVTFRLLEFPVNDGTVTGICLCYSQERKAKMVGEILIRYMTSSAHEKRMDVEFISTGGTYRLLVDVRIAMDALRVTIDGIDSGLVTRIRESLSRFTYYAVVVGFERDGELTLLSADEGRLLKNEVMVDGTLIQGRRGGDVDWSALLLSDA